EAVGIVLRVGLGGHHHQVGVDAVGDVGLGAVQHPVVPHLFGGGAHARQVTARIRLGHGHGEDDVPGHAAGHEAVELLLVAEAAQVRAHQAAVQGGVEV